jgi:energy-coupling factor transporter ATP-binding protein EcfA2
MNNSQREILLTDELVNIRDIIKEWIHDTTVDNDDIVALIVGKEGVGKSSLALTIAELISLQRGHSFDIRKNMHFTFKGWKSATVNSKPGDVQLIDEAGKFLLSRRAMSSDTVNALEFVTECRKFNNIHLICIPSIRYIDKYFREDRINCAFHVTSKGRVTLYPGYYATKLSDPKGRAEVFQRYTNRLKDTYRFYATIFGTKKWNEYEAYCKSNIKKDEGVPDEYYKHTWIRPVEAAKLCAVSQTSLNTYASKGYILARRLPNGHRRFSRESIQEYLGLETD